MPGVTIRRFPRWLKLIALLQLLALLAAAIAYLLAQSTPSWWRTTPHPPAPPTPQQLQNAAVAHLHPQSTPSSWRTTPDPAAASTAEQLENGVVAHFTLARPPDPTLNPAKPDPRYQSAPWAVSISANDANAWLATRLKQWLD